MMLLLPTKEWREELGSPPVRAIVCCRFGGGVLFLLAVALTMKTLGAFAFHS